MKQRLGIGIIGTGFARKVQIPAFLACENAAVVSVASGSIENARSTSESFAIPHFTADWRETAALETVDLVCITTPPNLHREMTLFCLAHGKHIVCEKPMAMSVAEAAEMEAASRGAGSLTLIDHELRFLPGRIRAFEMLREGVIGKVRHAKYSFRSPHRGDPDIPWNWWSDISQGGGALGAIGSHVIDSFNWFLGTDITSVFCQLQTHVKRRRDASGEPRDVTADDEANMLLTFANSELTEDSTGLVSLSMVEPPEYQNRVEFFGEKGALRVDSLGELHIAVSGETEWKPVEVDLGTPMVGVADTGFSRGFTAFAPRMIDAALSGAAEIEHAATFVDGVKVQKVLDAARRSGEIKSAVNLV